MTKLTNKNLFDYKSKNETDIFKWHHRGVIRLTSLRCDLQINTILGYLTADAKGLHPHWNGMLGADDSPAENSYLGLCVSAIINLPTFLT